MNQRNASINVDAARAGLVARRVELASRLNRVDLDQRHELAPLSADSEEQAAETTNDDVLAAIGDTVRAEIQDIDAALERIAAGHYGVCTGCGGAIEAARLVVVPYALSCSACANAA